MRLTRQFGLGVAALLAMTLVAPERASAAPFMAVGGETTQPIGHFEFCQAMPAECEIRSATVEPVRLDNDRWAQLLGINAMVNATIAPATDQELFGRAELWMFPATMGDCEDYVLLKRRILAEQGWPLSSLLITVVRKADGEGHAVLTVRTDRGDLILDNLTPDIRVWNETPYLFVKRQSERNTGRWVTVEDGRVDEVRVVAR